MDIEEVEMELDRVRDLIDETETALGNLKDQLVPYWNIKGDIEDAIRRTHDKRSDGAIIFRPAGAGRRAILFEKLMALAEEWGPIKMDYNAVKSRLAGYERDLKKLKNELKYLTRKADKNEQDQGRLF